MKMNFPLLKQLVHVIESDQPKFFNHFESYLSSENYIRFRQDLFVCDTEEQLIISLYGQCKSGAYSKLKGRFTSHLLDFFLMSKLSRLEGYSGTTLSKYWQLTLLFKSMGELELSKEFAKKGLQIAERKKKFKQAFKFSDYLKSYYLLLRWDLTAFLRMESKAEEYLALFNEEQKWKNIYFSLTYQLNIRRTDKDLKESSTLEGLLNQQIPSFKSRHALFYFHSSIVLAHILDRAYNEALDYINRLSFDDVGISAKLKTRLFENLKILKAQIFLHANKLDKAWSQLEDLGSSKHIFETGRVVFIRSRILLKKKKFQDAFDLFKGFYPKLKKIKNLELPFVEGFYLMHGLFYVLYKFDRIKCEESYYRSFRYYNWINSLPIYSKDKLGMNITLLIIDFLIGKIEGWASMYKKAEQLDLYRYRYLKGRQEYSTICELFRILKSFAKYRMDKQLIIALYSKVNGLIDQENEDLPLYFSEMELLPWHEFGFLALEDY